MNIDDSSAYQLSVTPAKYFRENLIGSEAFSKYSLGKQYIEKVDSTSANIREGSGRFYFKIQKNYCLLHEAPFL